MEIETEMSKEEGEISDCSDEYTPLERPADYSAIVAPKARFAKVIESESEDEIQQSSSDSDSDFETKRKKTVKPKLVKPRPTLQPKRKRYDIWSTRMQEDVLSETLNSCDVSIKDRSRDVESYDYTLSYRYRNNIENMRTEEEPKDTRTNNKRTRNDRKNPHLRLKNNKEDNDHKGNARNILNLAVTASSTPEEIVTDIANKLCEEKEDLIKVIVNEVGPEKAIKTFKEVQKIESEGGMLIMNQTRRRTPGGVYFFLIKHDNELTREQHKKIFGEGTEKFRMEQKERKKKRKQEMKAQLLAHRKTKDLPELLTRAEICCQELAANVDRTRKESTNVEDVINPPPTPETDAHDNENSTDGMDNLTQIVNGNDSLGDSRKMEPYEEDFLDINAGSEMDLF